MKLSKRRRKEKELEARVGRARERVERAEEIRGKAPAELHQKLQQARGKLSRFRQKQEED